MPLAEQCTAVILAYKRLEYLLASVDWAEQSGMRVLVMANGGAEEVRQYVATRSDWIVSKAHPSIAAAWNACIRQVATKYVMLLNDDAFVNPRRVEDLLMPLEEKCGAAITGACGGKLHRDMTHDGPSFDGDAHYIEGWCMAFSKKTWQDLGGFDSRFTPLYCEDSDFCLKAIRAGKRLQIVRGACEHVGQGSGGAQTMFSDLNGRRLRAKYMQDPTRTVGIHRKAASGDIIWALHAARSLAATGTQVFFDCEGHNQNLVDMTPGVEWGNWPLGFDLDDCYERPEAGGNYGEHPVLRMCREVGAQPLRERYKLHPSEASLMLARSIVGKFRESYDKLVYVGLRAHCRMASNWNGVKWSQLFSSMPKIGFILVDHDRCPNVEVRRGMPTPDLHDRNLLDPTGQTPDLGVALAIAMMCDAAVTVDTVHSSLANAADLPQVLLLAGIPASARKHPFGPECVILGPDLKPDCWPCGARGDCYNPDNHCLGEVSAEDVRDALSKLLSGGHVT